MRLLLLLCTCLPFLLFGQEQVSDIDKYGVYQPSNISQNVGFAEIDGVQYMLQENDSLIIFIWSDDKFEPLHTVDHFEGQAYDTGYYDPNNINDYMDPNRSLFDIRGNKYYRLFRNGLQVINILSGEVVYEYDGATHDFTSIKAAELYNDHFYFEGNSEMEGRQDFVLDIATNELSSVAYSSFHVRKIGDIFYDIEDNKKIYIKNLFSQEDVLAKDFDSEIKGAIVSRKDSSLYVVDSDYDVWHIKNNATVTKTNCKVPSDGFNRIFVNGSRLMVLYYFSTERHLKVFDIQTGNIVSEFDMDALVPQGTALATDFVSNETSDERFSILGFNEVNNFGDGANFGYYYIIDHVRDSYGILPEVLNVRDYTPFYFDGHVYFVSYYVGGWASGEFIVKYDLEKRVAVTSNSSAEFTQFATLGYPIADSVIAVTNLQEELPLLWMIAQDDSFTEVQQLNFLSNLGLTFVRNVHPSKFRFYFDTNSGLYSTLDNTRHEVAVENLVLNQNFFVPQKLSEYDDKLTYVTLDDHAVFNVLDINTGFLEKFDEPQITSSLNHVLNAGPFYFYRGTNSLRFFDSKTDDFYDFPEMTSIFSSWLTAGDSNAILINDSSSNTGSTTTFQIDYETNEITQLDVDYFNTKRIFAGDNNAYYFFDRNSNPNNLRIRLMKEDGSFSTIYSGIANPVVTFSYAYYDEESVMYFHLKDENDAPFIVVNDTEKTEILDLSAYSSSTIYKACNNNLVLSLYEGSSYKNFSYVPFQPLKELDMPIDSRLLHVDQTDSITTYLYSVEDQLNVLQEYHSNNTSATWPVENDCIYPAISDAIKMTSESYLLILRCNNINELQILNTQTNTLENLDEIYNGPKINFPANLLSFKNWIYFTAEIEDRGRQWYRIDSNNPTNILELISQPLQLKLYPNPTQSALHFNQPFKKVSIYNMEGKEVKQSKDYYEHRSIDVSNLADGIYQVIGIDDSGQTYQSQFVKVKD